MALMVAPREACENLQRLAAEGREGAYGFYEAVDYTPSRLPPGRNERHVRSFMAHHQGMSLLALVYLLRDRPMQRRFLGVPLLKAADLLLQERVPEDRRERVRRRSGIGGIAARSPATAKAIMRVFTNPVIARRRKSIFCPTAAITSSSAAPAAATAAGAIWRSRAGARMPRAIAGERSFISATWRRESSGPPPISRPCVRPKATRRSSPRRARSFGSVSRTRNPHRNQRFAGGRRGVAAHHAHQSFVRWRASSS